MKKLTIKIAAFGVVLFSFTGCMKQDQMNIDASKSPGNFLQLEYIAGGDGTEINTGLQYFGGGSLLYPSSDIADTATFTVAIQGPAATKDLAITIGPDFNATQDNFSSDSITYLQMPDSLYTLINTTATIKAGSKVATFKVVFYPSKVDITKSFMLPIAITNPQGYLISGNFGHIYFHFIGNPIAGAYTQEWIRYNNSTGTGAPAYDNTSASSFKPLNPNTISVASGTGVIYNVTFTNVNGVLSNFKATFTAASVTSAGITITGGPTVVTANWQTGYYEFNFTYNNSSGSPRVIWDKFTK